MLSLDVGGIKNVIQLHIHTVIHSFFPPSRLLLSSGEIRRRKLQANAAESRLLPLLFLEVAAD